MAEALVNPQALAGRAIGFLLRSFDTIRSVSAVPSPSSMNAEDPKKKKKKNLFGVAQFLPNWRIGYKMAKTYWRDVSYEITKVNLHKDGRHGKTRGIRYKADVWIFLSETIIRDERTLNTNNFGLMVWGMGL